MRAKGAATELRVIDTHAFAFSPIFLRENSLPEEIDGTFDTLVSDMERAGVERTIATVSVTKQDDLFETVSRGLERHGGKVAAQLHLAPNRPQWTARNLTAAAADPRIAGARAALSLFKKRPVDEQLEQVWDACEKGRLPVQLVVDASKFSEPSAFAALARQRPNLPMVVSVARARHRAGLKTLARFDSVAFQVPALLDGEIASERPLLLRWAVRHLPPARIMFGSDRLGHEASYFAKVRALRALAPAVREGIACQNALAFYGRRLKAWRSA